MCLACIPLAFAAVLPAAESPQASPVADRWTVYLGTGVYGAAPSKGIYLTRFDAAKGELQPAELVAEMPNPTFLALHPTHKWLYAASELPEPADGNAPTMAAFAIDAQTGKLALLKQQATGSRAECHLAVDRDGRFVLAASYCDGNVACLPIAADGRLGELACFVQHADSGDHTPRRQPRAHGITFDASNQLVFVPDLGLDRLMIYRLDAATGQLTANATPYVSTAAGAGPRHFVFHPNGRWAYVINERNSTIVSFAYDAEHGSLEPLETVSTLPEAFHETNSCAEIQVHPNGKFLYGSNRGHDSIAIFSIDAAGKLQAIGHEPSGGKVPRHFTFDPSGRFLLAANSDSNNVTVFRVDAETGKLAVQPNPLAVPSPMCVLFLP
jgi:6-phosphogluconolactonase